MAFKANKTFHCETLETTSEYKVQPFDEFLEKYFSLHPPTLKNLEWFNFNSIEMSRNSKKFKIGYLETCLEGISVKCEYQPEFGAGKMYLNELIDEWLQLQFSNRNFLTRIRIDSEMQRSVQLRKISLADVEQDMQRLYNLNSKALLNKLLHLFEQIHNFPCGEYVFSYVNALAKSEIVSVYRMHEESSSTATNSLDLKNFYENVNFKKSFLEEIPWTPIDPMEITPIHHKSKVAPRLFPYWGKNKNIPKERKRAAAEPILKEQPPKKKKKKNKNKKKKQEKVQEVAKIQKIRLPKSDADQESFSPSDLFDGEGHVRLMGKSMETKPKEKMNESIDASTNELEPINLDEYKAEAGCSSELDKSLEKL